MKPSQLAAVLFFVTCATSGLFSQVSLKAGAGFQISSITIGDNGFSTSPGWGSNYNLTAQFGSRLYVESGLQLYSSSQSITPDGSVGNPNPEALKANVTNMHIPVLIGGYFLPKDATVNAYLFGGVNLRSTIATNRNSDYSRSDFRAAHIGSVIGVGTTVSFAYAELAYDFALGDTFKRDYGSFTSRHNFFRFTLGVHLFK